MPFAEPNALFAAIRKGDVAEVRRLLDAGADPNRREALVTPPRLATRDPGGKPYEGDTPLYEAVVCRNIEIVKLLLAHGADPNARIEYGEVPLMEAWRSPIEMAHLLLDHGAEPDPVDDRGRTALMEAAYYGDVELVALLLARGANPDGATGWTPLQGAARGMRGSAAVIPLLLEAGANIDLMRTYEMTPLRVALNNDNPEAAEVLRRAGAAMGPEPPLWPETEDDGPEIPPRDRTLTDDDRAVLDTVLSDLRTYTGDDLIVPSDWGRPLPNRALWLYDATDHWRPDWHDDSLSHCLGQEKALEVTLEMREHLATRNTEPFALTDYQPSDPLVVLRTEQEMKAIRGRRTLTDENVRLQVGVRLPGYSPNRNRVVLLFRFAPSGHGASGAYLLQRSDDRWEIVWRDFTYNL